MTPTSEYYLVVKMATTLLSEGNLHDTQDPTAFPLTCSSRGPPDWSSKRKVLTNAKKAQKRKQLRTVDRKRTSSFQLPPAVLNNKLYIINHQRQPALVVSFIPIEPHARRLFNGEPVRLLHQMAWFMRFWSTLCNLGALHDKPSE